MNSMNDFNPVERFTTGHDIMDFAHQMVSIARTRGSVEEVFNGVKLAILPGSDTTADELVGRYYTELRARISNKKPELKKHSFN